MGFTKNLINKAIDENWTSINLDKEEDWKKFIDDEESCFYFRPVEFSSIQEGIFGYLEYEGLSWPIEVTTCLNKPIIKGIETLVRKLKEGLNKK